MFLEPVCVAWRKSFFFHTAQTARTATGLQSKGPDCKSIMRVKRGIQTMKTISEIQQIKELDEAIADSTNRPVLLFKHSLTCPISMRAYNELISYLREADPEVRYNLITVQKSRPISNEIASRLGVRHETPQAILVRNGREIWNASHFAITSDTLREAIKRHKEQSAA
jgi:bacillithiol system protein YtxJ